MKYLQLIRLPNLFLLALMQLTFRYGFLVHQDIPLALADWQYHLLVLATVLIAAAGYVINDIFDQVTDRNNAKYFVLFNDRQVANVFVNHDGHAFIECVRECHSKRVWRHDF